MKNTTFLFAILLLPFLFISASLQDRYANATACEQYFDSAIEWMTWEEMQVAMKKEPRKIFVDVYTDWCGWCKKMDSNTFQRAEIAKYMNANYYNIKFNAEQKEDITYGGKTYRFVKQGRRGYHELAAQIMNGRMSFPTVVFLDENTQVIQPIPGYQKPEVFEQIMSYFGSNSYKNVSWEKYQQEYKSILD